MKRLGLKSLLSVALCTMFFVCGVLLVPPASAAEQKYINGIDPNYPPFAYVDDNGRPTGFDVDSMNWIAKEMGFQITHKPMDWDSIVPALLARKIDMVCSGMSISPSRLKRVSFTEPYWAVHKVYLTHRDSPLTAEELLKSNKRVGVQRGTNEAEMLQRAIETRNANYTLRLYDSGPQGIEDVVQGRIDAFGIDSAPAEDAIAKGKDVKIIGHFGKDDFFAVATRNEDEELRKILNEGYTRLKATPYWQKLQTKYLK